MCSHSLDANSRFFGFAAIKGTNIDMGAHKMGTLIVFRVRIPNADSVFLTGSFNFWSETDPMAKRSDGVWEIAIPETRISDGASYKYKIYSRGVAIYIADPYSVEMEGAPFHNSIYRDMSFDMSAASPLCVGNNEPGISSRPVNIYEIAVDKWKRGEQGEALCYSELAYELAPYVSQMGYTHVGIVQTFESYFDPYNSCQMSAYYSVSSGLGGARELIKFVRIMHEAGIGVFFDWHIEPSVKALRELGRDYFANNAVYWAEGFGFDGIKISVGDAFDEDFAGEICDSLKRACPSVCIISGTQDEDAVFAGFDLVINREWTNSLSTGVRRGFYSRDVKAFERPADILAMPRTRVAEGKKALVSRFGTDEWRNFAIERAFLAYQMTSKGKKLTYMGNEIAQNEGSAYAYGVDWGLLNKGMNAKFQLFCSDLNDLYLKNPELWAADSYDECVVPVKGSFGNSDIYIYERVSADGTLAVVVNFSPSTYEEFTFMLPEKGMWYEIFNSDAERYGGSGVVNGVDDLISTVVREETKIQMRIPPLGVSILKKYER